MEHNENIAPIFHIESEAIEKIKKLLIEKGKLKEAEYIENYFSIFNLN